MSAVSELGSYLTDGANWAGTNGITQRATEHMRLALTSVAAAAVIALPLGVWLGHIRRGGITVQWIVNVGRAIPSLAILVLLFPLSLELGFGLGFWPTVPALVLLAIPPMFANSYAGVRDVDAAVVEAARGMGLRPGEVLRQVELPNALPLILTGLRVAALQVIATATLATFVGYNALGSFITEGYAQQNDGKLLTGSLAVAVIALSVDALFVLLVRRATPWRTASVRSSRKGTT